MSSSRIIIISIWMRAVKKLITENVRKNTMSMENMLTI
jgi:hypothetical protein